MQNLIEPGGLKNFFKFCWKVQVQQFNLWVHIPNFAFIKIQWFINEYIKWISKILKSAFPNIKMF